VVIGEGIETCLSVVIACPDMRVLCAVSLSNLGAVSLPPNVKRVILLSDNDAKITARHMFQNAINSHIDAGREVFVARPDPGGDFNDMIRE